MGNTKKDLRTFGIAMAVVLSGLGTWQLLADRTTPGAVLLATGTLFLLAAVAAPNVLRPLYVPWRWFGAVMGFIMTRVILTVFYYVVLTPFGLVRRALGKDSLERSLDGGGATWWRERDGKSPPRERYERQF